MRKLNQSNPVFQLILYEKEPQLFQHQNHSNLTATIQPKPETSSPFFGIYLVKIATIKTPGRPSDDFPSKIRELRTFQSGFLAYLFPA